MSRRRRIPRQRKSKQTGITRLQIGLVAGIAILMVVTFIAFNQGFGGGEPVPTEPITASGPPAAEHRVFAGIDLSAIPSGLTDQGEPALGSPDAPVTIVDYSDYQCPHCASFSENTLPEVIKTYVTTGKVRYIHSDMAILGEESQWAAQAAHCAADQGHFWEYYEVLFQRQAGRNQGAFSRDNLKGFAADLGLDTAAFNQCVDQNEHAQKVITATEAGKTRGVKGTPSFFVNDEFIEGSVPFTQMKEVIDRHLEGSS